MSLLRLIINHSPALRIAPALPGRDKLCQMWIVWNYATGAIRKKKRRHEVRNRLGRSITDRSALPNFTMTAVDSPVNDDSHSRGQWTPFRLLAGHDTISRIRVAACETSRKTMLPSEFVWSVSREFVNSRYELSRGGPRNDGELLVATTVALYHFFSLLIPLLPCPLVFPIYFRFLPFVYPNTPWNTVLLIIRGSAALRFIRTNEFGYGRLKFVKTKWNRCTIFLKA